MAHWAEIDENGVVLRVVVTENDDLDEGESWLAENLGGTWLKTSYNTRAGVHILGGVPFRKNFASVGGKYSQALDCFIPAKQEHESEFILNEETCTWVPPLPFPEDADYVLQYGIEPSVLWQQQEIDGELVSIPVPDILPTDKVYFWVADKFAWGMNPNSDYPKPDGDFIWSPVEKMWLETTPEPLENFYPATQQMWPSWIQNEDGLWVAPVEMPLEGKFVWDEVAGNWHNVEQYGPQATN